MSWQGATMCRVPSQAPSHVLLTLSSSGFSPSCPGLLIPQPSPGCPPEVLAPAPSAVDVYLRPWRRYAPLAGRLLYILRAGLG